MPTSKNTPLDDPLWRLQHVYSIVDKKSDLVLLCPNWAQKNILQNIAKRKIFLKARQIGISTVGILQQFDYTINKPNITSCIIAHERDSIKKLFRIVRTAYNHMDESLKPQLDRGGGSAYEMYFPILNSRIYCDLESRSDTIHWLHVSESAFIKDTDMLKSTLQAVPIDGRVYIESTPNGLGNLFYEMWIDKEQPYEKFFFPWFLFSEYQIQTDFLELTDEEVSFRNMMKERHKINITNSQIAFRRFKQKELGSMFLQEYPEDDNTCFLQSGMAAMDLFVVKDQIDNAKQPILNKGGLRIFEKYNNGHRYVCGIDCAEGIGQDYSVATIYDATQMEQIAVLTSQSHPYDFAHDVHKLLENYVEPGQPWPLVAIERNNHGHSVILELEQHLDYHNLYQHKDGRTGWLTDRITRPIMLDAFIDGVQNKTIKLNDLATLQECLTLVDNEGKIEAASGKHDDHVIASAIAIQMCVVASVSEIYINIRDKILM